MAIEKSLDYLDFEYECDVTLTVTNNETIKDINREYRELDKPTDVLSFPMIDWPVACDYEFLEQQLDFCINPDTGCVLLGDIVISMDKVESQAHEYGHSEEREFVFLIVHSMLHLFGYDHMEPDEEIAMISMQKDILGTIDYEK